MRKFDGNSVRSLLWAAIFAWPCLISGPAIGQSVTMDSFELGGVDWNTPNDLKVINPNWNEADPRYLWQDGGSGDGVAVVDPNAARTGNYGMSSTVYNDSTGSQANSQIRLYTYYQAGGGPQGQGGGWQFLRDVVEDYTNQTWELDTYNRMRFWVLWPSEQPVPSETYYTNFDIGTYYAGSNNNGNSAEGDGGWHPYHFYRIPYSGVWHQVIMDWHPTHLRGQNGNTEHGELQYPTNEAGYNYFDLLTTLYFNISGDGTSHPYTIKYDDIEFYREPYTEDVNNIYSIHGTFSESDNKLFLGWSCRKDSAQVNHNVRYAFQNIHQIGWNAATPAPNGTVPAGEWGAYNAVVYETTSIDVSGQDTIYVAIQQEGESLFRQIAIPLSSGGVPPVVVAPMPPSSPGVQ